jgi:hypothetical protein
MKKISIILALSALVVGILPSCKKNSSSTEKTVLSTPPYQIGQAITPGNLAAGSYKGTMTTGNTYTINGNFVINVGDTVLLQPGVTVCAANSSAIIIVKGVLISLGTQAQPNYFTSCSVSPFDNIESDPGSDPAWAGGNGHWLGINCDTTCKLCDIQWTHIEYVGGLFPTTEPFNAGLTGNNAWPIFFQNPNGDLILTDSWIYGSTDDGIRMAGGRIYIARNTLEKMGYTGGDGFNAKNGTQGDMCYNLCIGDATNSTKCSNKGGSAPECNINMYNNTYVDCGYRQASFASRGSDMDYEQQGEGMCYNNLIVNCRNGIRVGNGQNSIPWPDTTHLTIGYNYIYADSLEEVNQFFCNVAGSGLKQNAYIVPNFMVAPASTYLPADFYDPSSNPNGDDPAYNAPALVGGNAANNVNGLPVNDPQFVNFPLPEPIPAGGNLSEICSINTGIPLTGSPYNFRLKAGSPAIGKGYTGFKPFQNIINPALADVKKANLLPAVSQPSADIGCYSSNGSGNQH